jgi:hypothetical protein
VRWLAGGNEEHLIEGELREGFLRDDEMCQMNWIEGSSKDANARGRWSLRLAAAQNGESPFSWAMNV